MFNQLDHLIVAVNDLQAAKNNYQKLFGLAPVWSGTHKELGQVILYLIFKILILSFCLQPVKV